MVDPERTDQQPGGGMSTRTRIESSLAAGTRLSVADAAALLASTDLAWLGDLAHRARTTAVGDRVAFRTAELPAEGRLGADTLVLRYGRDEPAVTAGALLALRDTADAEPARQTVLVRTPAEPEVAPAESMRLYAVARLVLDNVADIACDLASHPAPSAELLLHFGTSALLAPAADFDADSIATLIADAGFRPVLVDSDGGELHDYGPAVPQAQRRAHPQSVFA